MTFFEFILRLIGLAILGIIVVAIILGFIVFKFKVLDPRQHTRNLEKAHLSNLESWETGVADIYTVTAKIEIGEEIISTSTEVICIPKQIAQTGFDAETVILRTNNDFGPKTLTIPLSGSYRVEFEPTFPCRQLAQHRRDTGFPFTIRHAQTVKINRGTEPTTSCSTAPQDGPIQLKTLAVFPTVVTSRTQVPISDILTRDEYAPDDSTTAWLREYRQLHRSTFNTSGAHRFSWRQEDMCWSGHTNGEGFSCIPLANQYCEPSQE